MNLSALAAALALCGHLAAAASFLPLYCADGVVRYQHLTGGTNVAFEHAYAFGIMRDKAGQWRLEVATTVLIGKTPCLSKEVISFDGTNIYSALYSDRIVITPVDAKPTVAAAVANQPIPARVCTGPYPLDHSSVVGFIWLAYLGGAYAGTSETLHRFPNLIVSNARQSAETWSCDLQCNLMPHADSPQISEARFILNLDYLPKSPADCPHLDAPTTLDEFESFKKSVEECRSLASAALTRAEFHVVHATNFNGCTVPTKFDCVAFATSGTGFGRFTAVVTNIALCSSEGLLPPLGKETQVEDRRMRYKTDKVFLRALIYSLPKGEWLFSTNDPRIHSVAAAAQPMPIVTRSFGGAGRSAVRAVFAVVLFAPLLAVVAAFWRRRMANRARTV